MAARRYILVASLSLIGSIIPLLVISLMSLAVPSSEHLISFFSVSLCAAFIGVVTCILAWVRTRGAFAVPLLSILLLPLAASAFGLRAGLEERTYTNDIVACADARRDGRAPILRDDPRYKARLDLDGDGRACEQSGSNQYFYGRE